MHTHSHTRTHSVYTADWVPRILNFARRTHRREHTIIRNHLRGTKQQITGTNKWASMKGHVWKEDSQVSKQAGEQALQVV